MHGKDEGCLVRLAANQQNSIVCFFRDKFLKGVPFCPKMKCTTVKVGCPLGDHGGVLLHFFRRRHALLELKARLGGYIKSRVMTLGVLCPTQALHQDGARKPGVSVSVRDPQWLERVRLTRFILVQRLRFGTDSFNPSTLGVCRCR